MKNWIVKSGIALAAMLALTACPKGGGKSAIAAPPASNLCTPDVQTGGCVGGVPMNATGRYSGTFQISNPAVYRSFLIEAGLCSGYQCNAISNWMGIDARLQGNGRAAFRLSTHLNQGSWGPDRVFDQAMLYANNNLGFQIVAQVLVYNTMIYPPPPNQGNGMLQIVATNTNGTNFVHATIYYRGIVIATGPMKGYIRQRYNNGYYNGQYYRGQSAPNLVPMNQ